jgi:hypothetical protein
VPRPICGVSAEQIQGTLVAIAPVVGSARIASAFI